MHFIKIGDSLGTDDGSIVNTDCDASICPADVRCTSSWKYWEESYWIFDHSVRLTCKGRYFNCGAWLYIISLISIDFMLDDLLILRPDIYLYCFYVMFILFQAHHRQHIEGILVVYTVQWFSIIVREQYFHLIFLQIIPKAKTVLGFF